MFSDMIFSPAKKIRKKFLKTCGLLEKETLYIVFQDYMKVGVLMQTLFSTKVTIFHGIAPI